MMQSETFDFPKAVLLRIQGLRNVAECLLLGGS